MAPRSRKYTVRYGGDLAGQSQTGSQIVPAYTGVHSCDDETHPGPPYFSGGPLLVKKKSIFIKRSARHYIFYHSIFGWYNGFMYIIPYMPPVDPAPLSLIGWGVRGWNATIPTHPIYQLGVSAVEMKDLPNLVNQTKRGLQALKHFSFNPIKGVRTVGQFLKRAQSLAKGSGDAYLYGAFGVAPLLQDLAFLFGMQEKLDKKLRWLRRHNGKALRRKVTLDEGEFTENIGRTLSPFNTVGPPLSAELYTPNPPQGPSQPFDVLKRYRRKIWFVAKYRYFIPELAEPPSRKLPSQGLLRFLLGLELNVSVVYKATPWSWLLDWFTSVGASISNVVNIARYGVIAEYAYVMCRETYSYDAPGRVSMHVGSADPVTHLWPAGEWIFSGTSTTVFQFCQREVATPFGFGVTMASLSAFQWSILAALGLSRRYT